jgi:hypothetical protein
MQPLGGVFRFCGSNSRSGRDLGDLDGAGKAFQRALTIDEKAFGPERAWPTHLMGSAADHPAPPQFSIIIDEAHRAVGH